MYPNTYVKGGACNDSGQVVLTLSNDQRVSIEITGSRGTLWVAKTYTYTSVTLKTSVMSAFTGKQILSRTFNLISFYTVKTKKILKKDTAHLV